MATLQKVRSRAAELEELFKRYPDVPREVIVKEDVLRVGQRFTEAALRHGEGFRTKMYGGWLFTFDRIKASAMQNRELYRIPDFLELYGDPYGLRGRLRVRCRVNPDSPYVVDYVDGQLVLVEELGDSQNLIAQIHEYRPIPKFWSKTFEDGTSYRDVCRWDGFMVAFTACQYWGPDEECRFCDINENHHLAVKRGDLTTKRPVKKVELVAEVLEEIFLREQWESYDRPRHVTISGGQVTTTLEGLDDIGFYMQYVRAIRDRIGYRYPITLQSFPKPKEEARRLKEGGLTIHHTNMEVWDPRMFEIICPGKARYVGREEWIRRMIDEVDVFGENNVNPGFVVGVETAQPWGFKTVEEAVRSTTEGFDFLMSHGVVPRPISWCVEETSTLHGQEPPPVDYFIQIDRNWYEILTKYRLRGPGDYVMGPGRNEYPNNASSDMGG